MEREPVNTQGSIRTGMTMPESMPRRAVASRAARPEACKRRGIQTASTARSSICRSRVPVVGSASRSTGFRHTRAEFTGGMGRRRTASTNASPSTSAVMVEKTGTAAAQGAVRWGSASSRPAQIASRKSCSTSSEKAGSRLRSTPYR